MGKGSQVYKCTSHRVTCVVQCYRRSTKLHVCWSSAWVQEYKSSTGIIVYRNITCVQGIGVVQECSSTVVVQGNRSISGVMGSTCLREEYRSRTRIQV
jgi:hypothetical protein